jgi:integrase
MALGRRRKNPDAGLEPRVYQKHGAFYYVHRTGKWERLGVEKEDANRKARLYNDPDGMYGTLVHWLDQFLAHCEARQAAGTLAERTVDDYRSAILGRTKGKDPRPGALRIFFAPPITPLDVTPSMVQDFLVTNDEIGRPVPANREKACLSACFSWLMRTGKVPGLQVNPCLRASGIQRNAESKRERYVTHDEYREVWAMATLSERLMMELTYRTLQRPESDIIGWTTANLITEDGIRKIRHKQNKTGTLLRIAIPEALDVMIRRAVGDETVVKLKQPLVHTLGGGTYTYDGLSSMLRRSIAAANESRKARGREPMESFGFRDLKGKGATDMWLSGVPIEQIQMLCGHKDKATTEKYIKQRWRETAQPNMVSMG